MGREAGEDMCFLIGATACVPQVAKFCFFIDSGVEMLAGETADGGSLTNVLLALAVAFSIEHNLSALGLFEFARQRIVFKFNWVTPEEANSWVLAGPVFLGLAAVGQA